MPKVPMPLPDNDYQIMNTPLRDFYTVLQSLPQETRNYVTNATHRLAEVAWIARTLEQAIVTGTRPLVQEGLLSLQMYLLLTCADALGHLYNSGGVGQRFREFFRMLPLDAQQNLIDGIYTWKTNFAALVNIGLGDLATSKVTLPSYQQIAQVLEPLAHDERLENVVDFLYIRRNYYTHESEYPQLGYHPNLSVMQNTRLNVPNTAILGEFDRLQPVFGENDIYFTYYRTDDPIATVRWSVVRGLGNIIGCV